MLLAQFILRDMESILKEWETFAATLFPALRNGGRLTLRDDAQQILEAVARDLSTPQTRRAQVDKSKGLALQLEGTAETAAQTHAVLRAKEGFDINQLVAEYRALRASVLRKWIDACHFDELSLQDIIRFNEAIDQATAESIAFFDAQVEQSRNLLLGMLGHDMRSPLSTIQTTAQYLAALNAGDGVSVAASRLIRSGASIKALLDDLVDFGRVKLGLGINISLQYANLADLCADEMEQLRGAHPNRRLEMQVVGDTRGYWDSVRLQQLLRNLVSNAIKYGELDASIQVLIAEGKDNVRLEVTNKGPAIDASILGEIFRPLIRGPAQVEAHANGSGLGLGLYIVHQIALAHGGEVAVRSEKGETLFVVRLPRRVDEERSVQTVRTPVTAAPDRDALR